MVKKLVSKSEFARLAGVTPAAVTKAANGPLKAAVIGKKLDINHPDAAKYLAKKYDAQTLPPATGIDTRYEDAIEHCRQTGKYTVSGIQRALGVPYDRARGIVDMMKAAGLVPAKGEPPPEIRPTRIVKGHAAKTITKKSEALENIEHGHTLHQVPEEIEKFVDMTLREIIERFGSDYAFIDWLKATKAIEDINEKRLKNAATRGDLVSRDLIKRGIIDPIESAHIKLLTDGAKTIARRVVAMTGAGRPIEDSEKFVAEQITSFIRPIKSKVARALKNA